MEFSKIIELIHAVSDSDLTEFQMQEGNLNISMSANKTVVEQGKVPMRVQTEQTIVQAQDLQSPPKAVGNTVKSPLVGTFYAASSPKSDPFVKEGDYVKKGQVLGIVEAMKLMNEIESEFEGTVKQILVKNEQMVEFGQPMFVIG